MMCPACGLEISPALFSSLRKNPGFYSIQCSNCQDELFYGPPKNDLDLFFDIKDANHRRIVGDYSLSKRMSLMRYKSLLRMELGDMQLYQTDDKPDLNSEEVNVINNFYRSDARQQTWAIFMAIFICVVGILYKLFTTD